MNVQVEPDTDTAAVAPSVNQTHASTPEMIHVAGPTMRGIPRRASGTGRMDVDAVRVVMRYLCSVEKEMVVGDTNHW